MTPLNRAGFFNMAKITGVQHHTFVSILFGNGQRIAKVADGTTDHSGIMGRIKLYILMTTDTHIDAAGCGNNNFLRSFQLVFSKNQPAETGQQKNGNRGQQPEWPL